MMTIEEFCEQYGFPQPTNEYEREARKLMMDTVLLMEAIFGKNIWKVYKYIFIFWLTMQILSIWPISYVFTTLLTCLVYLFLVPFYVLGLGLAKFSMFVHQTQVSATGKMSHTFLLPLS